MFCDQQGDPEGNRDRGHGATPICRIPFQVAGVVAWQQFLQIRNVIVSSPAFPSPVSFQILSTPYSTNSMRQGNKKDLWKRCPRIRGAVTSTLHHLFFAPGNVVKIFKIIKFVPLGKSTSYLREVPVTLFFGFWSSGFRFLIFESGLKINKNSRPRFSIFKYPIVTRWRRSVLAVWYTVPSICIIWRIVWYSSECFIM